MAFRLLPYHVRLAVKSLRRDPGLSVTILVVMTVVAGIFCTGLLHYLRFYGRGPAVAPHLHHVEVDVSARALMDAFHGTTAAPNAIAGRMRVSYPNYRLLAGSHIPPRETGTFRSRLIVRRPEHEAGMRPQMARFVNADFFSMFGVALRAGAPWTRKQEEAGAAVVVLSKRLAAELFPGDDAIGASLLVDGLSYRVVGICAADQPTSPAWDRAATGGRQDVLYLPFAEHLRLLASPEMPVHVSPRGPTHADLLASDEIFVSYWADLPTDDVRRAYAAYLTDTFGRRRLSVYLRDLAGLGAAFPPPPTAASFFLFLTALILAGGGLIMSRLLLAKGLARGDELGIFRALGAPRRAIFGRQLIEAGLLSGAAGVLSVSIAGPQALFYNRSVADTDIPLGITPGAFAITVGATLGVGLLCAIYPAWRASTRPPTISAGRH